ncbi:hypothetical protein GGI08_000459 [Coemansia sp. S2]|nr:hypothetical protein GGI08_000459 [Coemansia sp. S2]KAJ2354321.1 hypothetical protein GGH92_000111 [Coemansia sp. RSA 2673]
MYPTPPPINAITAMHARTPPIMLLASEFEEAKAARTARGEVSVDVEEPKYVMLMLEIEVESYV